MTSHVISVRVPVVQLVQLFDILESAGVVTANMPLATLVRTAVEGVCRRGETTGLTIPYTEMEAQHKLATRGVKELELDLPPMPPLTTIDNLKPGHCIPAPPNAVVPDLQEVAITRVDLEKRLAPFVEKALKRVNQARMGGIVKPVEINNEVSEEEPQQIQLICPWQDTELAAPAVIVEHVGACPVCAAAVESKDQVLALAIRIVYPNLPSDIMGTDASTRLFTGMAEKIANYCSLHPDAVMPTTFKDQA